MSEEMTSNESIITAEKIHALVIARKDEILNECFDQIKTSVKTQAKWAIEEGISKIVKETITTELKAEISAFVIANKNIIMESLQNGLIDVSAEIGKTLLVAYQEKAKNSWDRREIIKALFGS